MKENTILLLVAEGGLFGLAAISLFKGDKDLASMAAGAFVGVLAGHLNGQQKA